MPLRLLFALYGVGVSYAALMYYLGPAVPVGTIALGFGVLVIVYLAVEWVATPALAIVIGLQARWWSVPVLLLFGTPLVILFTVVSPVVGAGSEALGVPVPWLAVPAKSRPSMAPIIQERLLWWGLLHLAAATAGWFSRGVWPLSHSDA